jgi:AhpD family alkylhydroperoxidase
VTLDTLHAMPDDDAIPDDAIRGSVLAQQPDALMRFLELYGTLWSHGELPQSVKEVARLRNARTTDCAYCRNVRFAGARDEGLTEDRVALIADGFEDTTDLDAREKAAIRFTDTFLREPSALGDAQRAELLELFTPGELVELATGVALFMGFSKIAVALGPPPEMDTLVVPTPDWPPTA